MTLNKTLLTNVFKKIWFITAILIISAAICSSLFRSLTPWATQYKPEVERHLSQLIGQPVVVNRMHTGWYWFHPVLKLEGVTLKNEKNPIYLEKLFIGINLWDSLINWRIQSGLLYLKNIHLVARKKNNRWILDGLAPQINSNDSKNDSIKQIINLLTHQDRLIIKEFYLTLYLNDEQQIPLKDCQLLMVNRNGQYKISASATIYKKKKTQFNLLAELDFNPEQYTKTRGHLYFSTRQLVLTEWQPLLPTLPARIKKGIVNLDLWVDLQRGAVSLAQGQISLNDLSLIANKHTTHVPSFYANMSWKPDSKGWEFNADKIQLDLGKDTWPENKLVLRYDDIQHNYLLFVKTILIDALLKQISYYPNPWIQHLSALKPVGSLHDVQLAIKNSEPNYFLTRFTHLGWSAHDPRLQVANLSGAIEWAPQEGHLELDATDTTISYKHYPKQSLELLNGVIDWKELNNGLRVSIDRLVFSQPELTFTIQGALDEVQKNALGAIHLDLDFAAKNIQQWMPYLPKSEMKIKLYNWLNKDIKRIAEASGTIKINGLAGDFPFDNNRGEFSIVSHAVGGELFIGPNWPLINELEAYLRVKNRTLDIDIIHGNAQGVPIEQMNLRIDNLGTNKENMLIHTAIKASGQKMLDFILASPLKDKLAKLKMLAIKGFLSLDLSLEIPLYPENDDNLAKGHVTFADNTLLVKQGVVAIPIDNLKGSLSFDEKGVTQSLLEGTAFAYPLTIKMASKSTPEPRTEITVTGECTIAFLKSKFDGPFFKILKGLFPFQALLTITANPNDMDKMVIQSNLDGLAINLPEPLGKKLRDKAPVAAEIEFNAEQAFRIRAEYNNRLNTDLLFVKNKNKEFTFKVGQIALGANKAVAQSQPGLTIVGALDGFNLGQWDKVVRNFSTDSHDSFILNHLNAFNLHLKKLVFLEQSFDNLSVKGGLRAKGEWNFNIAQQNISAELNYNYGTHLLSGFIHHLYLEQIKATNNEGSLFSALNPKQIPNLNVRIDNFYLGKKAIGNVTLKSHSNANQLAIDYCRVDTEAYQWLIDGNWQKNTKVNRTELQFKLHVNNLAKSLELWDLSPAVDASKGDLVFKGGWNDSPFAFSLARAHGTMYIQLNNGRITHLSPETEKQLGLGKLLSILSLQTIPRRLKLDFSDLSNEGYSFDVFKGNFILSKGIVTTKDSTLDGPVAYATMKGDLDLVRHLYDLNLRISPHITASLPVVATIAGGPIAGLAAWVANKIINQSMQKIIAYSYKVSGPWSEPVVQQLTIVKKKYTHNS